MKLLAVQDMKIWTRFFLNYGLGLNPEGGGRSVATDMNSNIWNFTAKMSTFIIFACKPVSKISVPAMCFIHEMFVSIRYVYMKKETFSYTLVPNKYGGGVIVQQGFPIQITSGPRTYGIILLVMF